MSILNSAKKSDCFFINKVLSLAESLVKTAQTGPTPMVMYHKT